MKFIRSDGEKFEFEFSPQEKDVLLAMLKLYPLVPEAHHSLSKKGDIPDPGENQRLLDEALNAQRLANKKQILALLDEAGRFAVCENGFVAGFMRSEMEWLLQVLNDVRVGSWITLGSPGYPELKNLPDDKSVRHIAVMEIAGAFQGFFLGTLNGDVTPDNE